MNSDRLADLDRQVVEAGWMGRLAREADDAARLDIAAVIAVEWPYSADVISELLWCEHDDVGLTRNILRYAVMIDGWRFAGGNGAIAEAQAGVWALADPAKLRARRAFRDVVRALALALAVNLCATMAPRPGSSTTDPGSAATS
jgi:hypothetical protein